MTSTALPEVVSLPPAPAEPAATPVPVGANAPADTPPQPTSTLGQQAALGFFAGVCAAWVTYFSQDGMSLPEVALVWRAQDGGQTWTEIHPVVAP